LFEFLRKKDFQPSSAASVLSSLINNPKIPVSTQRLVMKEYRYHASKKEFEKLCLDLGKKKESKNSEEVLIGQLANSFLISLFKNKEAII
jgi:hypothetical protein